jgi:2'-5' RNA ligase
MAREKSRAAAAAVAWAKRVSNEGAAGAPGEAAVGAEAWGVDVEGAAGVAAFPLNSLSKNVGIESWTGGASLAPGGYRMRVFFALWPGELARTTLGHATRKAVRSCGGRPVPEQNFHVTLTFLGSVALSRLAELGAIAAHIASSNVASPFELVFDRVEHWEKPRVLVATASDSAGAISARGIARALSEATFRAGFDPDQKPFHPHVTLARKIGKLTQVLEMHPVSWGFDAFALVESRTLPEGPVYTVIESYPLAPRARVS